MENSTNETDLMNKDEFLADLESLCDKYDMSYLMIVCTKDNYLNYGFSHLDDKKHAALTVCMATAIHRDEEIREMMVNALDGADFLDETQGQQYSQLKELKREKGGLQEKGGDRAWGLSSYQT